MSAVSAYAPTGRNPFLRRFPESTPSHSVVLRRSMQVSLLLLVIRFWNTRTLHQFRRFIRNHKRSILEHDATRRLLDTPGGQMMENTATWVWDMLNKIAERLVLRTSFTPSSADTNTKANSASKSVQETRMNVNGSNGTISSKATSPHRTRTNLHNIQAILKYWFGQFQPENAQKKLWMIASSSTDHRARIDAEISDTFESILVELSQSEENGLWNEWIHDSELYGYQGKVAAIIALDQFSRHMRRHEETRNQTCSKIPPQTFLDALAYKTAQLFTTNHKTEIDCGMVPLPMYIFALMPYRHASSLATVKYVQDCIEQTATMEEQMDAMIRRFRKATNRRMALLQDEARRSGTSVEADGTSDESNNKVYTDDDILETFPFEADMTTAHHHPVYKTIIEFLSSRGVHPVPNGILGEESLPTPVIVSLSGGVDSMVIAAVLAGLREDCNYNLHIVAIHIDYANRPESMAEAEYVRTFCEKLDIVYRCRRIDEVTRGVTARDDYERIARESRYDSYRETVNECREQIGNVNMEVGVMLGHHRGDLRENVLSNSHKGCGPLDLSGMTRVSQNDGVVIYRPLLPMEKKDIFDFAHTYGIPYFKDTTPHWSTRGKLRNKLLPLLQEIYGEGSMDNLSSLATESDEARDLLHKAVLGPFLNQVERKPMGITFETAPWKDQGSFFWKFVLREALHSASLGMFSDKSVMSFLERVKVERIKAGWLQCRRDYAVYLQEDGRVFVFFPDRFPFRKCDQYDCVGKVVEFGEDHAAIVGPWKIQAKMEPIVLPNVDELLEQKAVSSMEMLMDGHIQYYIKSPLLDGSGIGSPKPLVFVAEYTRQSRPRAWKSSDLKVQSTLPILGNDDEASKTLAKGSDWCLVCVTLMLNDKV